MIPDALCQGLLLSAVVLEMMSKNYPPPPPGPLHVGVFEREIKARVSSAELPPSSPTE